MDQSVYYKLRQFYYKLRQLLRNASFITKCVGTLHLIIENVQRDAFDEITIKIEKKLLVFLV